jgi:hypothetical protein
MQCPRSFRKEDTDWPPHWQGVKGVVLTASAAAPQNSAPADFSSNLTVGMASTAPAPSSKPCPGIEPGPVLADPAHPFVPNGTDKQPTFRICRSSQSEPDALGQGADEKGQRRGPRRKIAFTPQSSCVPGGVPMFMGLGGPNPDRLFCRRPRKS